MHLLVVSHACALALNRQIYAEIRRKTGWRITVVVPAKWKDEFGNAIDQPALDGLEDAVQIPVRLNGNIILHSYRADWRRFLEQRRPDLIYVNHEPYAVATAQVCWANMRSIKAPFGIYSCQNINKPYPPPFSWMERVVYRNSQFAFPITEDVAGVMQAKGFAGRSAVCALPLDPEKYHPRLRAVLPEGFGRGDGPVFGFVGRLTEAKGLRTLALALGKIRDVPWRLVVIGTGDFQNEFEALLVQAGVRDRVKFFGYVPHVQTPQWLAAMDVLVLPSETQSNWKEQFGRVIPEALACGAAVVGSDSGEIPNLIRQSGGGLVFRERDPEALAQALRTMSTEPQRREEMASAGRAWVVENISLDSVAKRMIETFEAALDRAKIANG
jgi:glycosyltransferase involved in cell wall biosynthesis